MAGTGRGNIGRTVADSRALLGAMLSAAQANLQKVAIVFLAAFLGTFYALWLYVWDALKADLFSRLSPAVAQRTLVIATTPFDVPLLQVKIALVVGALVSLPLIVYYSRGALYRRGYWPQVSYRRRTMAFVSLLAIALFIGGIAYAYSFLFPLLFQFLASNAVTVGFEPTYSIVEWARFVFVISLAMGLAAELPLFMTATVLAGVVSHETYRNRWRHAVVGIAFVASVINGSPDPFSMALVAVPMTALYGVGLACTAVIAGAMGGRAPLTVLGERWKRLAGLSMAAAVAVGAAIIAGVGKFLNRALARLSYIALEDPVFKYIGPLLGLSREAAIVVIAGAAFFGTFAIAFVYYVAFDSTVDSDSRRATATSVLHTSNPSALDLAALDAAGVRAAPVEVFAAMSEREALSQASVAMNQGDPEKARAILDRFDDTDNETGPKIERSSASSAEPSEMASTFRRTSANVLSAFTAEETTEEDIGGYYYDIAFILDTLRSKSFLLIGLFVAVFAGVFTLLYQGGIGLLRRDFLSRLPATVRPDQVDVVALHPVEVLVFAMKLSALAAVLAVLPFLFYYAWPALRERGLASGDRRVLLVWAGALSVSLVGGVAFGYTTVAPTVISWLAADVIGANMVVAYRISAAGWLVFFTTIGIGLLAVIPVTMLLFHRGGLVSYRAMYNRWREVTVGVFALTAYLSPRGVFMMFLLGIPIMLCYGLGLGLIWFYMLGERILHGTRNNVR